MVWRTQIEFLHLTHWSQKQTFYDLPATKFSLMQKTCLFFYVLLSEQVVMKPETMLWTVWYIIQGLLITNHT
jgi:hypothetical protein